MMEFVMDEATAVRRALVDRLDAMARLLEDVATEAVNEGEVGLAADLWVSSARILSAAEELWCPRVDLAE
jgi:hypothetical protein